MLALDELTAISPIDGRYRKVTQDLARVSSEFGLIRYRVQVECAYLIALSQQRGMPFKLTQAEHKLLQRFSKVALEDALVIRAIEREGYQDIPATKHDVKAVEYFLRLKFKGTTLERSVQWIHFGLTSEDVNNLAYTLQLRAGLYVTLPSLQAFTSALEKLATKYAGAAMLARTHGQSASPTTFGKEMRVFVERLKRQEEKLSRAQILAKLNGATGNYNAQAIAFPKVDWTAFSKKFIEGFNSKADTIRLTCNMYTTQIEPHDSWAELFQTVARTNTILIDFAHDMWRYISDGWVKQKTKPGEVGSSAMPHKVNPIDFENGEGNLGVANALLGFLAAKLPISRLQRDLSDSTVERTIGVALAHSLIGYKALLKGLSIIRPDAAMMVKVLNEHPEVLAEAIQTILRREGVGHAYEALKAVTRGQDITLLDLQTFISGLPVKKAVKKELLALTPATYIGKASDLARG